MIQSADVREWRAHDVVNADGHRIGMLEVIGAVADGLFFLLIIGIVVLLADVVYHALR
nr:hypothetical protein OG409_20295 [Streptomyces sp. NBC_00974]